MARRQISLEQKPSGWIVQTRETVDGLLLYWYAAPATRFLRTDPIFLAWLSVAIMLVILVGMRVIEQHRFAVIFGCWVTPGILHLLDRWYAHRTRLPEAVLLGSDWFGYFPGAAAKPHRLPLPWWPHRIAVDVKLIFACAAADLGPFLLERHGGRRRILFQRGAQQAEVGIGLEEPERIWLYDLLEKWRQGIDVQKRREPAEISQAIADWVKHWSDPNRTGIRDLQRGRD